MNTEIAIEVLKFSVISSSVLLLFSLAIFTKYLLSRSDRILGLSERDAVVVKPSSLYFFITSPTVDLEISNILVIFLYEKLPLDKPTISSCLKSVSSLLLDITLKVY